MNDASLPLAQRINTEVFLPALQRAAGEAQTLGGSAEDMINGAMNAFSDMLVILAGKQAAVVLLRGLAEHLEANTPDLLP
jgi:hypothetical protein